MKTHLPWFRLSLNFVVASLWLTVSLRAGEPASGYVAHEWGTFTSVQGSDGVPLSWRPLESSKLPGFVYDWRNPGCNRAPSGPFIFAKGELIALQRMETPVIYFYSDRQQKVDVQVDFPQGTLTEWFPQATQIGPSITAVAPDPSAKSEAAAPIVSAKPVLACDPQAGSHSTPQRLAKWEGVEILPSNKHRSVLPRDKSGSHYFAARETDANELQIPSFSAASPAAEHEKFIFYRGLGNFPTPLRVTQLAGSALTVANSGSEPIAELFVLGLQNGKGQFVRIGNLQPGEQHALDAGWDAQPVPLKQVTARLAGEMESSLVEAGLYPREAAAMVKTWEDSWFAEDGVRVLYLLPRAWTDATLPLTLTPAPREVVRVMVGRAELITSKQQQNLAEALVRATSGDDNAREQVLTDLKKIGRFAEPALILADKSVPSDVAQNSWALLAAVRAPATRAAAGSNTAR